MNLANLVRSNSRRRQIVDYLVDTGRRYWPRNHERLARLPLPQAGAVEGRAWQMVTLPDWAADLGVGQPPSLLVDCEAILPGPGAEHTRCDWWAAAISHLAGLAERRHEERGGPIHSYSFRMPDIDARLFEHAWVNRIFLFLRRLAARSASCDETEMFGPLPAPQFDLTHDVDAVRKTGSIRLKQTAFHALNAARLVARGKMGLAAARAAKAAKFAVSRSDYSCIPQMCDMEERYGVRSAFHFFARPADVQGTPKRWLFDPSYDVRQPAIRRQIAQLFHGGWKIGLHQSFESWRDSEAIAHQRRQLEESVDAPIVSCRQHWLRFSWADTWAAQQEAGLSEDATLGFNDRAGFRNGAALAFHPWDPLAEAPLQLMAVPMILMDSHIYDYQLIDAEGIESFLHPLLEEVRRVHGHASLLWHPHTLSNDYGWSDGYETLLKMVA